MPTRGANLRWRGIALIRRIAVDAGVHQAAPQVEPGHLNRKRRVAIEADGECVVPFREALLEFVAQADD